MQTKFCVECGQRLETGNRFCNNCGMIQRPPQNMIYEKVYYEENKLSTSDHWVFGDIGKKIKKIVEIGFWIEIILCILSACLLIVLALLEGFFPFFVYAVLILIFCPLAIWISCFLLFAFGQLVDNSDIIVKLLERR